MYEEKESETIGMLLDIEHLYGEHEGRLGPFLLTICLSLLPILLYVYTGAFTRVPLFIFIPFEIFITMRVIMLIPGRERHRVELYKKQLNDDYMNTADLLYIKTVHPDGCVEFIDGKIQYYVCCFNGTSENDVQRSIQLSKFLDSLTGDFEYDTYIHNITDSPALYDYYNRVSNFDKNISAKNFISIIDHNIELTENMSIVQCTIYAIKGYRSDWKQIKSQIESTLSSRVSRCYKKVYRVSEPDEINMILNRNVDSVINITDLLRRKYANQRYDTSKVLAYDLPEDKEIIQGKSNKTPVIVDVAPKKSFHISYEESEHNNV